MALSCKDLKVERFEDPPLLRFIHMYWPEAVLVTSDDQMPLEHGYLMHRWGLTVAVIDPLKPKSYQGGDMWDWEIIHRWVHNMQTQPRDSVFRYNAGGRRIWKRPRRIKQLAFVEISTMHLPSSTSTPPRAAFGTGDVGGEQLEFDYE